jgi:hypothetical protein
MKTPDRYGKIGDKNQQRKKTGGNVKKPPDADKPGQYPQCHANNNIEEKERPEFPAPCPALKYRVFFKYGKILIK